MAVARRKSGTSNFPLIPVLCEVCRNRPVVKIVVDFMFACERCAKKIETAIWHRPEKRTKPKLGAEGSPVGKNPRTCNKKLMWIKRR